MQKTATLIGPADDGRPMSLDEFSRADGQEGFLYELGRGIITVVNVPGIPHAKQVHAVHRQLHRYGDSHPDQVNLILGGSDSKILVSDLESERHPDAALYKSPPPDEGPDVRATWPPDLVVEVVSPSSGHRDYEEKREEYLRIGVREYWIIDASRGEAGEMLVLRRSGSAWKERVVRPFQVYQPRLLPGFSFDLAAVFRAAAGG